MIKLLNKILAKFQLELVSTKVDTSLVEGAVKFIKENPQFVVASEHDASRIGYVGDITAL